MIIFKKHIKLLQLFIPVLLLSSVGILIYANFDIFKREDSSQKAIQEETENLIAEVGELIVLPEGEKPTVATINDSERLKTQPFFSKAKNGDIVLIYSIAKKAILYDPIQHKIIEVSNLTENIQ